MNIYTQNQKKKQIKNNKNNAFPKVCLPLLKQYIFAIYLLNKNEKYY